MIVIMTQSRMDTSINLPMLLLQYLASGINIGAGLMYLIKGRIAL